MARRVVMGQQNDGSYGLRVSAAGVDAFVGDGQGGDFTFNSAWTDMSKILFVGRLDWSATGANGSNGFGTIWTDPGYLPFIEVRRGVGTIIYDDWNPGATNPWGNASYSVFHNRFQLGNPSTTDFLLLLAMKIAVPKETG
jgi:hypothetical protein